jgi:hypothetical protein
MRDAMETMNYETVDRVYTKLRKEARDLDVKLMRAAEILHLKLEKEKEINEFIESLKVVANYKTIKKSVSLLEEMVEKAKGLNVEIDPVILNQVNGTTARLMAERNLQFQMEKVKVSASTHDDVKVLEDLIHKAKATGVANVYTDTADVYLDKMKRNIKAREILDLLEQYPIREYPEIEEPDPKNKNKKQPEPPKKKKKKKQPPFPMPEWATELKTVETEVNNLKQLVEDKDSLEFDTDFLNRTTEQFDRFKKEIGFRKWEEDQAEQARLAKEAKKKAAAKNKK